jgi:hypothetical protein
VHHAETKAGFGVVADYYRVDTDGGADAAAVASADVQDVTHHVVDGRLEWGAPPGRWRIIRFGASLTGQTNGPATPDVTGLEVDKLDGGRVAAYLDRHLAQYRPASGRFAALLSDSIESGSQNWTDDIAERFRTARGYDLTRWLPTLGGYLVDGAAASDGFLYDYRRTVAELLASEYYGTLAAEAHSRGMTYYAEALEDRRPQLGDDLAMRSHADVPMGAMWTFDADRGPRPTYVADLKGASSVAHVYGKAWTGAEAFTSFDRPWGSTPASLKHVADLQLALGVTRFCIHTSPHQPIAAPPPGIALAPFLGQAFTVHETWASMAAPWIDYLARCSAVLSAGVPAVDIAVFVGEEAPVTGLFGEDPDDTIPDGIDFDYVGFDALESVLRVQGEDIVAGRARYRLLFLGGSSRRMTAGALRRIATLLDEGATVVGSRPEGSPSLGDDPREVEELCERIWSNPRARGRVVATADLALALTELGIHPESTIDGPPLRRIARVVDGVRVTFVANPSGEPVRVRLTTPRSWGPMSAWDPVQLTRTALPDAGAAAVHETRTFVLELPRYGSVFLVPGAAPRAGASAFHSIEGRWALNLPDRDAIDLGGEPRLWTEVARSARGFSGVGVYRAEFEVPEEAARARRVDLELGELHDIARVSLNGVDCGVAWTPPFRLDVTSAVRAGRNVVEIAVATPWRNRLIAEAANATGEVFAPMTTVFEPGAAPLPAGLSGPVRLRLHA